MRIRRIPHGRTAVPQPTCARLESGRRSGAVAQMNALAWALDITPDTLSGG